MNSSLFDLENKLISLKSSKLLLAIKAEFEAEGTRIDELSVISYLCLKNQVPLTLKIGGPCAKRDIYEAFQLGASNILVPMVESEFAFEFCYRSYKSLIPAFEPLNICPSLSINIESKTAINNFDSILKKVSECTRPIKEIVIGRSDLAKSFNMTVFSRFQAINGPALQRLVNEHNVQIKTFPDEVLVALGNAAGEVVFERGSINAETKSLSNHLLSFRKVIKEWFTKGEQEFSRIRDLPFKFPDSV